MRDQAPANGGGSCGKEKQLNPVVQDSRTFRKCSPRMITQSQTGDL